MMRPAMSAPEPAVSGTISRIARVGYSCAPAQVDMAANSRAAAIRRSALMTTSRGRGSLRWQSHLDYAKSQQALSPVFRHVHVVHVHVHAQPAWRGKRHEATRRRIVAADIVAADSE